MLFGFNLGFMGKARNQAYQALSKIFYNGDIFTDSSMINYLKNTGYTTTRFNAPANASNAKYFDGLAHSMPVPVQHTLGADNKKLASSVDVGWTNNLDNTYTGLLVTGDIVGISTDTTGTVKVTITLSSVTAGDVNGYSADGTYTFEETLTASLNLTGTGFNGIVTVVSIEAITLPTASYIQYLAYPSLTWKQLSSTGDVGEELVTNGDFSEGDTGWSGNLSYFTFDGEVAERATGTTNSGIYQNILTVGKTYIARVDVVHTGGSTESSIYSSSGGQYLFGSGTNTFTFVATGTDIWFFGISDFRGTFDNISVKEVLPISTTYTLDESFQYAISSTAPLSADDITYIDTHPNAMYDVQFNGLVLPSGFAAANIKSFLDGTGGDTGDYNVYDITDQTFNTFKTISNGTSNVNTNYLNGTTGATNLKLVKDASGRTTGVSPAGVTQWAADGRTAPTTWTITPAFTVTETLDGSTYTWLSNGNYYIEGILQGTYVVPTGVWTITGNLAFDGVTTVTARGTIQIDETIIIP